MHKRGGFTLAELLIVVAVIAVLVAVSIPTLTNQLEKSRQAADIANLRVAYTQIKNDLLYLDETGNALKTAIGTPTAGDNNKVWVNADAGTYTAYKTGDTFNDGVGVKCKATLAAITTLNDGIPSVISYSGVVKNGDTKVDAWILATITYTAASGSTAEKYELTTVTFAPKGSAG